MFCFSSKHIEIYVLLVCYTISLWYNGHDSFGLFETVRRWKFDCHKLSPIYMLKSIDYTCNYNHPVFNQRGEETDPSFFSALLSTLLLICLNGLVSMRVCICPCAARITFKWQLFQSHCTNWNLIWKGCPFHEAPPKLFKELGSVQNSGCHSNQKKKL